MNSIPKDWSRDRLKDVTAINASALPANTDPDYELYYLEISNVNYNGIIDKNAIEKLRYEDAPSRARRRVRLNDTLISSVRPNLQAVAFIDDERPDFICSTGFNVVRPTGHKMLPRFTYYSLISEGAKQHFESTAKGVGYPAVDDKDFGPFVILLPPLLEQQRIAAYLDASCAAIDAAVTAKRRQLEILDDLCSSILLNAVTLGIQTDVRTKETHSNALPRIPIEWRLERLKSVAAIRYGLGQPPDEISNGVAMIRATDIDAGVIRTDRLLQVDPEQLPLERNPYLKKDDIIVVRSGAYTGDSAIVPSELEGSVAGYDMVVTVTRAIPKFVAYGLLSRYILEGQLLLLTLRAAQPHLNAEELGTIVVALPPTREEQQTIVDYLDDKLGEVKDIVKGIDSQIATLTAYRKSLIHECVTGQRRITESDLNRIKAHGSEN